MPTVAISLTKDLRIVEGDADTNYDTQNLRMTIEGAGAATNRSLVHVDLTPYLHTSVSAASMDVTITNTDAVVLLNQRVTRTDWSETTGTWNSYAAGLDWTTAGGDVTATGQGSWTAPAIAGRFTITGLSGLAQDAIDNRGGQLHFIMRLQDESTPTVAVVCRDRDWAVAVDRPVFNLSFTEIVSGGVIAAAAMSARRRCTVHNRRGGCVRRGR